jgi:ankyrin repeat protein
MIGASHLLNEKDSYGKTALCYACKKDQYEVVQWLLTNCTVNVNHVDHYGTSAMRSCCHLLSYRSLELLINEPNTCISMYQSIFDTFYFSVSTKFISDLSSVHYLLSLLLKKISLPTVNSLNTRQYNLIHAHVCGHWLYFDAFHFLMSNGYECLINQQDLEGNTPLHYACRAMNNVHIASNHIIKLNEQPSLLHNIKNDKGRTPLHHACFNLYSWSVAYLLESPCIDVNLTDNGGENALHHIIQGYINNAHSTESCKTTVHFLLSKNPFLVRQKNNFGETAYDYACRWSKIVNVRDMVPMNGRLRQFLCMEYDRKFWNDLITILESYKHVARYYMFDYLIKNNINENSN